MYAVVDAQKQKPLDLRKPMQCLLASTMATVVYGARYDFGDEGLEQIVELSLRWMTGPFAAGMSLGYWTDNIPSWVTKLLFPRMVKKAYMATFDFQNFLIEKVAIFFFFFFFFF